jgi:hypothetical protein
VNGEKLKAFPLKSRMKQGCPLSLLNLKDLKDFILRLLILINTFSKVAGHKINIKYQLYCYTSIINSGKRSQENNPIHNNLKKNTWT